MIALDTHALLWWTLDPKQLSRRAQRTIDESDRLGVPTIVFWEVALLARRKRIALPMSVREWTRSVLSHSRVESLPLTAEIAVEAEELAMHADPADRFIVATARRHGCSLVTKDVLIHKAGLAAVVW
ncbi:MAG TPA: type II toxin-antitoxin system VapC family toxin [Polyangia bacterium]